MLIAAADAINAGFVSREESSTPASGYYKNFNEEQQAVLEQAFKVASN